MADINGRSFLASLSSISENRKYPIGYMVDQSIDGGGWLVELQGQLDEERDAVFRFDFIEKLGNRLYYSVSAGPDTYKPGAKVGVSRNGYLGFYSIAQVTDFLKVELEGQNADPTTFEFILRDERGYRVGRQVAAKGGQWTGVGPPRSWLYPVRYLNVEADDIVHFQGRILEEL